LIVTPVLPLLALLAGLQPVLAPIEERDQVRQMLMDRRYDQLEARLRQRMAEARSADAVPRLGWTLNAFESADPAVIKAVEEWAQARPRFWGPSLARALTLVELGSRARGTDWAANTSAAQFSRQRDLLVQADAACRSVLAQDPANCPCHFVRRAIARDIGVDLAPVAQAAFAACPSDFALNTNAVATLKPRHGGSYAAMRAEARAARARGVPAKYADAFDQYEALDRADLLTLDGNDTAALKILDEAIARHPGALAHKDRALIHCRAERHAETLADTERALQASGGGWIFGERTLGRILEARVCALRGQGRYQEARQDVDTALRLEPTNEVMLQWRAYLDHHLTQSRSSPSPARRP
jgi:tetratricopeptide (TPR) repeat protein